MGNDYSFDDSTNTLSYGGKRGPVISASKCALTPDLCYDHDPFRDAKWAVTKCHLEFWQSSHLFGKKRLTKVIVPAGTFGSFLNNEFGDDTPIFARNVVIGNIYQDNGRKSYARPCYSDDIFEYYGQREEVYGLHHLFVSKEAALRHHCEGLDV